MAEGRPGYGSAPGVVAPNPGRATVAGVPGGVRVPWLAGLLSLLVVAAGTLLVLGRTGDSPVPQDLLVSRASLASATAESIRKGLDESVDDLVVLADVLAQRQPAAWDDLLTAFVDNHRRYLAVYVVDGAATGEPEPRHLVGAARPRAELLPQPLPTAPGIQAPREGGASPVLLSWAPFTDPDGAQHLLVGRYDVAFFDVPLGQLAPGDAYLVDDQARVVGATRGFRAFQPLPRGLGEPAERVLDSGTYVADVAGYDVRAASAVSGASPAGRLGLAVVSEVDARSLALPAYEARRLLLLVAGLTALLSVLSFFWFYLAVIGPVRRLAREAERVAFGDRSAQVHVIRYDEVGLVTRALERCRSLLARPAKGR